MGNLTNKLFFFSFSGRQIKWFLSGTCAKMNDNKKGNINGCYIFNGLDLVLNLYLFLGN